MAKQEAIRRMIFAGQDRCYSISVPWIYSIAMADSGLGNVWLVFSVPDSEIRAYLSQKATDTCFNIAFSMTVVGCNAGFRWPMHRAAA